MASGSYQGPSKEVILRTDAAGPNAMTADRYEVLAVKYAELKRDARSNFVDGDPHETHDMPLDYFVWVARNDERTIVIDTGFGEA
ncbi:MAG TPA: hypothetical protein VMR74_03050, partial [Gammaproteobacteria bacterium]|nr:hypothetical protein [Gammaproteobacteria bacterium]